MDDDDDGLSLSLSLAVHNKQTKMGAIVHTTFSYYLSAAAAGQRIGSPELRKLRLSLFLVILHLS